MPKLSTLNIKFELWEDVDGCLLLFILSKNDLKEFMLVDSVLGILFILDTSLVSDFRDLVKISISKEYFYLEFFEDTRDFLLVFLYSLYSSSSLTTPIACKSLSTTIYSTIFKANVPFASLLTKILMFFGKAFLITYCDIIMGLCFFRELIQYMVKILIEIFKFLLSPILILSSSFKNMAIVLSSTFFSKNNFLSSLQSWIELIGRL